MVFKLRRAGYFQLKGLYNNKHFSLDLRTKDPFRVKAAFIGRGNSVRHKIR